MARGKKCKCPEGLPAWLATFADLMSLLLTFFVLLLSFASMEEPKVRQGIQSVQEALGVLPKELTTVTVFDVPAMPKRSEVQERYRRTARQVQERMQERGVDQDVNVEFTEKGGLKINLPSAILFDTGSADLKPAALPLLQDMAGPLSDLTGATIQVRGFTDNRPLRGSGRYRSNWELSYGRALTVFQSLQELGEIPAENFEPTGMGEMFPVASNESDEGREANRRVELHVMGSLEESQQDQFEAMIKALEEGQTPERVTGQ